ncbi:MAG: trehalose-6-phosphate synthase [Candidatus Omnitrophica bacterium]|nr:trehalose-6-phosphate synthase [Candidatus Omnitrophota bacterium]
MRVTLRLILWLVVVASAVVFLFASHEAKQERLQLEEELARRAVVLSESLQDSAEPLLGAGKLDGLKRLVERFADRERLAGVAIFSTDGQTVAVSPRLPAQWQALPETARAAMDQRQSQGAFLEEGEKRWHLQAVPLWKAGEVIGSLTLFHNADYIAQQCANLWRQNFFRLLLHVLLISFTTLLIVQISLLRPLSKTVEWMRGIRLGEGQALEIPKGGLFAPLARELAHLAKNLTAARNAAEQEARLRLAGQTRWTPERLKEQVRNLLKGGPLVVISNREPYLHVRQGRQTRCIVPASGLVTAVEPILRACEGTWIAHGSGDADREAADPSGRLRVPPEEPRYTLRRVWLDKEEEDGYYYGFSNEGLWPLCHIAHTRPIFRVEDWKQYQRVNAKFAEAALDELAGTDSPSVLIQDYHFALLPRLIKEKRPDARVALFWHIPWPNPEAFGICPWARELLNGMLGADLLGFHIQFHCNNFLDTADRLLESRIDWEQFAVNRLGHKTWVKPFPISLAAPPEQTSPVSKENLWKDLGVQAQWLGVGVDRVDYTKGIAERFRAVERFLEKHSNFIGKFTFVEIGAPSRTLLKRYHDLGAELDAEAERINRRFQTRGWKPIVFLQKHHSHEEILPYYRAADVCLVTSLHDGMNLVAKEFAAARSDLGGALILSRFAGASRELKEALLVNPYDIDQVAGAIHYALTMDPGERRSRMAGMRSQIEENNVYRWAANLVTELAQLTPTPSKAPSPAPAAQSRL